MTWLAVDQGSLAIGDEQVANEVVVFDRSEIAITMQAIGAVNVMVGSSAQHPHDLVLGNYSVHTTSEALAAGEAGVRQVTERLKKSGKIWLARQTR